MARKRHTNWFRIFFACDNWIWIVGKISKIKRIWYLGKAGSSLGCDNAHASHLTSRKCNHRDANADVRTTLDNAIHSGYTCSTQLSVHAGFFFHKLLPNTNNVTALVHTNKSTFNRRYNTFYMFARPSPVKLWTNRFRWTTTRLACSAVPKVSADQTTTKLHLFMKSRLLSFKNAPVFCVVRMLIENDSAVTMNKIWCAQKRPI